MHKDQSEAEPKWIWRELQFLVSDVASWIFNFFFNYNLISEYLKLAFQTEYQLKEVEIKRTEKSLAAARDLIPMYAACCPLSLPLILSLF